jgi:hypothetical protein
VQAREGLLGELLELLDDCAVWNSFKISELTGETDRCDGTV